MISNFLFVPNVKKRIKLEKKRSGIKAKFVPRPPEDPAVIEARWEKKKDRIHELANNVSRLRLNVTKDLESDNERTFLIALVIALMDRTGERIGNEKSIKDGHYGVTYFKKSHATIRNNEVDLDYIGKSGVPHNPIFSSDKISKALKRAIKNSPSKYIFETSDGLKIHQYMVNDYLRDFSITGKDLRGYFINRAMTEKLKSIEIPETEKDRKKLFTKTCKQIASKIGHGAGTCKKHYIVPELMEQYIVHGKIIDLKSQNYYKDGGKIEKSNPPLESRMPTTNPHKEITNNTDIRYANGGIPDRYKNMGFSKVGQKKKSTRPQKKWMVLAKKGDKYKVVHGGQKGMQDFSQHQDKNRQKRFWNRMGGFDSEKASDPFSPLYWHKRFGTWEKGGVLEDGAIKVAWIDANDPETLESKMFDNIDDALKYAEGKTFLIMELEDQDDDYYKWNLLPYGEHKRYKGIVNWMNIFEEGGIVENNDFANSEKNRIFIPNKITKDELQSIISGKSKVSNGDTIQAALAYIRREKGSNSIDRGTKPEIEEERLKEFINNNNLWYVGELNPDDSLGRGGEHVVYEDPTDKDFVLKTNNLKLYGSWSDYLINLLLNNTFFPDTSYKLIGFKKDEHGNILPVVRQYFVTQADIADLKDVQKYLFNRGFVKVHPLVNAYRNWDLGVIIGDLHDRNILIKKDLLFFIDTKFFISHNVEYIYSEGGEIKDENKDFASSEKSPIFVPTNVSKDEISKIIKGTRPVTTGDAIQAVARYLRGSEEASPMGRSPYFIQGQDEERLREYISTNNLWVPLPDSKKEFSKGGEAIVYLYGDYVIKINDAVFYGSWQDYFNSLLLHNYFFSGTAYELIGFSEYKDFDNRILYAVVKQSFFYTYPEITDLSEVRKFMSELGFNNTNSNNYYNPELGITVKDLHEGNVLTKNNKLHFIDTVFYIDFKILEGYGYGGQIENHTPSGSPIISEEQAEDIKKRSPNISFQERSLLGMHVLSKQEPITLPKARAQVVNLKTQGSRENSPEEIKNLLKMYYPEWTEAQIEDDFKRIQEISKGSDFKYRKTTLEDLFEATHRGRLLIPDETKNQIQQYIKEGIFIKQTDRPVIGSLPISRFNGVNADILPSQNYVYRMGVGKWKIKIREGERPHVLINIDQKGTPRVKDGHHRLKAYEELGFTEIPVIDVNGKILGSINKMSNGGMVFNENLAYLLNDVGGTTHIGEEKGSKTTNGISLYKSPIGSYRYVKYINGIPVSAIQVMSRDGINGYVSNAYTAQAYRRQGHGTDIINKIKKDFKNVSLSEDLSGSGRAFKERVTTGNIGDKIKERERIAKLRLQA